MRNIYIINRHLRHRYFEVLLMLIETRPTTATTTARLRVLARVRAGGCTVV